MVVVDVAAVIVIKDICRVEIYGFTTTNGEDTGCCLSGTRTTQPGNDLNYVTIVFTLDDLTCQRMLIGGRERWREEGRLVKRSQWFR